MRRRQADSPSLAPSLLCVLASAFLILALLSVRVCVRKLHYTIQLGSMSSILGLPSFVSHTAIVYFKRFFLHESVMEYSPKDVA